jgi:hypothetical protein
MGKGLEAKAASKARRIIALGLTSKLTFDPTTLTMKSQQETPSFSSSAKPGAKGWALQMSGSDNGKMIHLAGNVIHGQRLIFTSKGFEQVLVCPLYIPFVPFTPRKCTIGSQRLVFGLSGAVQPALRAPLPLLLHVKRHKSLTARATLHSSHITRHFPVNKFTRDNVHATGWTKGVT